MFKSIFKSVCAASLIACSALHAQQLVMLAFIKTTAPVRSIRSMGNYVYFSEVHESFSYFKVAEITSPSNPVVVDSFMTAGLITDFDLNQNYAYLSMADNEFGLRILDISNPADIKEVVFLEGTEANGTYYRDNFLYVADGGGLKVYDVSRPDTLNFVWSYSVSNMDGFDVFVLGNLVYLAVPKSGLHLLHKTTHNLEGLFPSPEIGFGVSVKENYAYITDTRGFIALDVSNPQNPVEVDTLAGSGNSEFGGGITILGNYAYFADAHNGLRIIDLSDPSNLREIDTFFQDRIFAVRSALKDTLVYLASGNWEQPGDFDNGVYILRNDFATSVRETPGPSPQSFVLKQNYPNPFNPITTIEFVLLRNCHVMLQVLDVLGKEVATLVSDRLSAGTHKISWNTRGVANGIYLYRLQVVDPARGGAGEFVETKKLVLLK